MPNLSDAPWSAAFISWVLKQAVKEVSGLSANLRNLDFPYNSLHTGYAQAIRNNPSKYPFELLNPNTPDGPAELERGDIVVKQRGNRLFFNSPVWSGFSHGDIVVRDRRGFTAAAQVGGFVIGGNLANRVHDYELKSLRDHFVIIRPKNSRHAEIIARIAETELRKWKSGNGTGVEWKDAYQEGARQQVNAYKAVVKLPPMSELDVVQLLTPPPAPPAIGAITPFIHSLESFHPNIQYELTRRRVAAETANSYMPFVKLTSLSRVLEDNLETEPVAYCPSLGIHGEDVKSFEDIYSTQSDRSIIGYAINKTGISVPVLVADASKDAKNIPIPGITEINAERSTAGPMGVRGGLLKADLKITAYSVGQVDALLRYFLRPGTRVVLEMGRISSNQSHPNEKFTPFDWKTAVKGGEEPLIVGGTTVEIETYFGELIKNQEEQKKFIKKYIYNNYGNYEVFIAYVVKFNLKYNKNNTFEIDLTLHSVQQFEVPTKHTGVQATCPSPTEGCKVMDIQEYFNDTYSWKNNSFSKLMSYYQGETVNGITATTEDINFGRANVIPLKTEDSNARSGNSTQANTRENEYFVTWRFFIEKILNDRRYGIAAMLGSNIPNPETNRSPAQALVELALLRPVLDPTSSEEMKQGLIANQCGYHPNLRSVDAGIMVIYNPIAQAKYRQTNDKLVFENVINVASTTALEEDTASTIPQLLLGSRIETAMSTGTKFENLIDVQTKAGTSLLTKGVWLNTKAIKEAFTGTDTITAAINMLLTMMNSATEGYWNLQLYSTDVQNPGLYVIDMGVSKTPKALTENSNGIDNEENEPNNILNTVRGINVNRYRGSSEDESKYIYMFNRGTKRFDDGELGSDLIDLNVEFNMPQVIAVQAIANIGGPAQKGTLQSINIEELTKITLIKDLYTRCKENDVCIEPLNCESDQIRNLRTAVIDAERELALAEERAAPIRRRLERVEGADNETLVRNELQREIGQPTENLRRARVALQEQQVTEFNPNLVGTIREYADLGTALEFIEINRSRMMKELNLDSTNADEQAPRQSAIVHAFNSSNLTKTVVDVTLPGIGGISLFQSFLVDRVPSIIDRGFYVVTKITHQFTTQNGWITKIQGRFRFRPTKTGTAPYDRCDTLDTRATQESGGGTRGFAQGLYGAPR